eukprot:1138018-Pelagomonas_calceolata.AAC.1
MSFNQKKEASPTRTHLSPILMAINDGECMTLMPSSLGIEAAAEKSNVPSIHAEGPGLHRRMTLVPSLLGIEAAAEKKATCLAFMQRVLACTGA